LIREFVALGRSVLGLDVARRGMYVYPDDTFIVSYPRSGNTWTRFLVANLLHPTEPVTFETIEQIVPDMHAQSKRFFRHLPRPRVIKSHEYFDPRYRRVIYIVRDPRDIVLSSYDFHRKQRQIADDYPIDLYVKRFLEGDVFSVYASWGENVASWLATRSAKGSATDGIGLFGSWGDNVSSWLAAPRHGTQFLVLRYEAMLKNPERELEKIAMFFGIEPTAKLLSQTVARSSADTMRKLEQSQSKHWVLTKNTRQDIAFMGAAMAGGWKSKLPPDSAAEIEKAWGHLMKVLGYQLSSEVQASSGS
jgi:Sulfotransferase domain